tara:strand:- start:260 stop:436 length:177 start_codon:yes stop_codon:yes gene_type:complete
MSQLSAPIDYIVEHILPNYSDDELSGMLAARTNKDSLLYRAIIREMGERCANDRDGEH